MSARVLHFTLGPVQGFIADARRVRDLWAGSFLLSWLSGQAMVALEKAGGKIVFPKVADDPLFLAIRDKSGAPHVGSLPNRFKADVSEVQGNAGEICRDAVLAAWGQVQSRVWDRFLSQEAGKGLATKDIWDRQVKHFWEMAWVEGAPQGDDGRWLDMRKNWRSALAPDEPGDLCRLMGRYQEVSGYHRIGGKRQQGEFWGALAEGVSALDLKKDERLCAIALIKRFFPLIAEEVIGWQPGKGVVEICHWPSVSYIAAVPWLKAVEAKVQSSDQSQYWQHAADNIATGHMGEFHTRVFNLPANGFFKLDGHLLHADGIRDWPADGLEEGDRSRTALLEGLQQVKGQVGGSASEFYAVLIMDGDRIGAKIGEHADLISTGLAKFTASVQAYFDPSDGGNPANGVLIYAGGDDVLALVPVDSAIEAARALRQKYQDAFRDESFTLSGAIVFGQYKIPLRSVLRTAHHYLDDVAKDENGRDSLAIAVRKTGGVSFDWVSKWDGPEICDLTHIAKSDDEYSSSFFYNLRERYAPLFAGDYQRAEREIGTVLAADIDIVRALILAEYKKQFGTEDLKSLTADEISRSVERIVNIGARSDGYDFDAPLVARFIGVEGRWGLLPVEASVP